MEHLSMLHALVCVHGHAAIYATAFLFFSLSIGTAHWAVFWGCIFPVYAQMLHELFWPSVAVAVWRPSQPGGDTVHLV